MFFCGLHGSVLLHLPAFLCKVERTQVVADYRIWGLLASVEALFLGPSSPVAASMAFW
jgi:hypothetical protein